MVASLRPGMIALPRSVISIQSPWHQTIKRILSGAAPAEFANRATLANPETLGVFRALAHISEKAGT